MKPPRQPTLSGGTAVSYRELISVFDHIRRAAAWARWQLVPTFRRHRRRTSMSWPITTPVMLSVPHQPRRPTQYAQRIRGEDTALVRPYVLTIEERARRWSEPRRRTLLICPHINVAGAC